MIVSQFSGERSTFFNFNIHFSGIFFRRPESSPQVDQVHFGTGSLHPHSNHPSFWQTFRDTWECQLNWRGLGDTDPKPSPWDQVSFLQIHVRKPTQQISTDCRVMGRWWGILPCFLFLLASALSAQWFYFSYLLGIGEFYQLEWMLDCIYW